MLPSIKSKLAKDISIHVRKLPKKKIVEYANKINEKYNIPYTIIYSVFNSISEMELQADHILFCVANVLGLDVNKYYNDLETRNYKHYKYEEDKKIDLIFDAIKINEDQYLTKINMEQLRKLAENQLIHYEERTQRPMVKTVKNGNEYYKHSIVTKSVNAIIDLLNNNNFIPNTLTFNMPEEALYEYDENEKKLYITSIPYFDIIDGYHRYVALSRLCVTNPDYDFTMELRIVSFSINKARRFIFQEDKKNKMTKIESKSFDQDNIGNKVVEKIIAEEGDLKDIIVPKGKIDSIYLSYLISSYLTKEKKLKNFTIKDVIEWKNIVYDGFVRLLCEDVNLMDKRWNQAQIYAGCVCVFGGYDIHKFYEILDKLSKMETSKKAYVLRTMTVKGW